MLYNTFIHIPGIGKKSEQQIWDSGILSWEDWHAPFPEILPEAKKRLISHYLPQIRDQQGRKPDCYGKLLPANQHWRLFPHFRKTIAYFDIETNGRLREECEITTIALYDGHKIKTYTQGRNLEDFIDDIAGFEIIVTYNGKSFDVPVIESCLHTTLPQVHIDLRHILYNLGYRGGLKGCEQQLGIYRHDLEGVNGFFAVILWQEYQRTGNEKILETLLAYNTADAVNLECLLVHAYNLNIADTPFRLSHYIPIPEKPISPYTPDPTIIARLKNRIQSFRH
ncbi:MAG: ribonuclease H-like domain-containing protein [Desulfobulbaceae bacterium]|uniref:Ribonuclease H-like domain-containing protein n=1 Tax=Candidatus Desulfobia pelagia TaxID=2841692 RepID=A0A8J6NBM3_9BACT|nr:ribonuclease H-like domain-containing protein [Candidatus Desulfobia pelagia]